MSDEIPAYFEDIEPFHEIEFNSLIKLTDEEKSKYDLLHETHRVPDAERFSFLQSTISFFALGIDSDNKVKSAVLVIDDAANGTKMYNDLVKYNSEPDLALEIEGDGDTADSPASERIQRKSFTWHLGQSAMTFSLLASNPDKHLARIHLRIVK